MTPAGHWTAGDADVRRCPACSFAFQGRPPAAICPNCSRPFNADCAESTTATLNASAIETLSADEASGPSTFAMLTPGCIFASRYRVINRIGRGGMGEVYRADDLTLGRPVALTLLRRRNGRDEVVVAQRLIQEARVARDISHPNVCRVYDIGRADDVDFLSMEFVDGETLSAIVRGASMTVDTAIGIAYQICAGLTAAHDRGVLHCDIKPSNIMVDRRGRVRVMDFGLAISADGAVWPEVGTKGYIAPELRRGGKQTCRSDIYALGVVMYELFVGERLSLTVGRAGAGAEFPGSFARDEPVITAIIERCLSEDPAARPVSVQEVAAMLPGGDPFVAALARGQQPSPVAGLAGEDRWELRPTVAALLTALAVSMALLAGAGVDAMTQLGLDTLPVSGADLAATAEQILRTVVPGVSWVDRDYWFEPLSPARRSGPGGRREIGFVYRASASPLVPRNLFRTVAAGDPPADKPGMATLVLDARGHLVRFITVAGGVGQQSQPGPEWDTWFAFAGLDPAKVSAIEATDFASVPHDRDLAWRARADDTSPRLIRAATLHDSTIYFSASNEPLSIRESEAPWASHRSGPSEALLWILVAGATLASAIVASRNLQNGVGHRLGARRIGVFITCGSVIGGILRGHHVPVVVEELGFVFGLIGWSLAWGGFSWLAYLAAEPFIRRKSPLALASWSRVLDGRFRDSMVGRDVLIGICSGALIAALAALRFRIVPGRDADVVLFPALESLRSWRHLLFAIDDVLLEATLFALGASLMFVVATRAFRHSWIAVVALMVVSMPLTIGGVPQTWLDGLCALAITSIAAATFLYSGLLTLVTAYFVERLFTHFPVELHSQSWHFAATSLLLAIVIALAIYGGVTSCLGRRRESLTV